MSEVFTVVQKACGHFGLIREKYSHSEIGCSQCEVERRESINVSIMKKKFVGEETVPALPFNDMEKWLKKQLEIRKQ